MLEKQKKALEEVKNWIEQNYNPIAIIASGSIVRGTPNNNSDFDIYVIHDAKFRQRIQKYFNQVPCEIFVNNIEHTKTSFLTEQNDNRPVTAHMLATGVVILGEESEVVKSILNEAKEFQNKPKVLKDKDITMLKYSISNLLEDANDIAKIDEETCNYILGKITDKIIDYWFLKKQKPLPRIKERFIILKSEDIDFFEMLCFLFKQSELSGKLKIINEIVEKEIGMKGFFEWQSEQQPH